MENEARNQKIIDRIKKLLKKYKVSEEISYSLQEKNNVYQCVIRYQKSGNWDNFWVSTGLKVEKGNLRNAKKKSEEIANIFRETVKEGLNEKKKMDYYDFQSLEDSNTTNYKQDKITKADWDFYEYMEYWLYNIIQNAVAKVTFVGYKNQVTKRLKDYFIGLRHSIATLLHLEGVDIRDLQEWLGHENITSTNRYTRTDYKKQVMTGNTVTKIFEKQEQKEDANQSEHQKYEYAKNLY